MKEIIFRKCLTKQLLEPTVFHIGQSSSPSSLIRLPFCLFFHDHLADTGSVSDRSSNHSIMTIQNTKAVLNIFIKVFITTFLLHSDHGQQRSYHQINDLDSYKRNDDAAQTINSHVSKQQFFAFIGLYFTLSWQSGSAVG